MKTIAVNRRQVLRGAGGFSLALPFMPSLIPRRADGATVIPGQVKRLMLISSEHGNYRTADMFPQALATNKHQLFPGHEISYGKLVATRSGTDAVLSNILTAPAADLTDGMIAKMNVIQGFGMPFRIAHQGGGHLGNFSGNSNQSPDGAALIARPAWPTLDQVLAHSKSFYADLSGIREPTVFVGNAPSKSYYYSNPDTKTGAIQGVPKPTYGTLKLYDLLFGTAPAQMPGGPPPRKAVVDKVLAHYKSVMEGNRRISPADKQRLADHMSRLGELERRLTISATPVNCGSKPKEDSGVLAYSYAARLAESEKRYQLVNEVIALAFMCNVNRIAVVSCGDSFMPDFNGDWHTDVGHGGDAGAKIMAVSLKNKFRAQVLDMAKRLDVPEAGGNTYLDNSLIYWSNEAGEYTHWQSSLPVITFGSANGFLKTGQYIDYRNVGGNKTDPREKAAILGLTYQRWLATMAQAMGLPRAEFEKNGKQGYGDDYLGAGYAGKYVPGVVETASEVPFPLKP